MTKKEVRFRLPKLLMQSLGGAKFGEAKNNPHTPAKGSKLQRRWHLQNL